MLKKDDVKETFSSSRESKPTFQMSVSKYAKQILGISDYKVRIIYMWNFVYQNKKKNYL